MKTNIKKSLDINLDGFDTFRKNFKKLFKANNSYDLADVFPDYFVQDNTDFNSLEEMIARSGLPIQTMADIDKNEQAWENFILKYCDYVSWQDLLNTAIEIMRRNELDKHNQEHMREHAKPNSTIKSDGSDILDRPV